MSGIDRVPALVSQLYGLVDEFERLFPGRHFTPDGHLVGSLGEVWAAHLYGLELYPSSAAVHDARSVCGRQVQVKATQRKSVALTCEPEHLIVLQLGRHGEPVEVYNGPGVLVWEACGRLQKNGQRTISVTKLRALMDTVHPAQQVPRRSS